MTDLPDGNDGAISDSLAEDFGEEAARFLTRGHDPDALNTLSARIRGITDLDLLQELIEAEVAIAPRQDILGELNARRKELKETPGIEIGPRYGPLRSKPPKDHVVLDENGEEIDRGSSARSKVNQLQRARTDGGSIDP